MDEWKSYFKEIKEIAKSCKAIEEFWNELKRRCHGLTFKDLQEEFDYSTALLGGVTPDGEYRERSLRRFIRFCLALSLRTSTIWLRS
ncbi:hypothetical protein [Archaeoglobus sp.]